MSIRQRVFAPELEATMGDAPRLWSLLGHPQYEDTKDLGLLLTTGSVCYERQRRDLTREINASRNFYKANHTQRDSYRSRIREGGAPRGETTGRFMRHTRPIDMILLRLRTAVWAKIEIEP